VAQADILGDLLKETGRKLDGVLNFDVSDEGLIRRLSGRRTCGNCGATYHVTALPPRVDNKCDHCGCPLVQRSDDNPDSIRTRLVEYANKTAPLLTYYEERGLLHTVDSNADPDSIFASMKTLLKKLGCSPTA
jgi:adenylate kinase